VYCKDLFENEINKQDKRINKLNDSQNLNLILSGLPTISSGGSVLQ